METLWVFLEGDPLSLLEGRPLGFTTVQWSPVGATKFSCCLVSDIGSRLASLLASLTESFDSAELDSSSSDSSLFPNKPLSG